MTDRTSFEAQLGIALERYAERAPVDVDPGAITRAVAGATAARPALRLAIPRRTIALLVALALLAAVAVAIAAGALTRAPALPAGTIFVWEPNAGGAGSAFLVHPAGGAVKRLDLGNVRHCAHLVAGRDTVASFGVGLSIQDVGGPAPSSIPVGFRAVGFDVWSQDGRWLAFPDQTGATPHGVTVVSLVDHKQRVLGAAEAGGIVSLAWAPDGHRLAIARQVGADVQVEVTNLDGTDVQRVAQFTYDSGAGGYPQLQWSASGRYLGWQAPPGASDGAWQVVDVASSQLVDRIAPGAPVEVRPYVWTALASPDGQRRAFYRAMDLVVARLDGSDEVVRPMPFSARALAWSPDSAWVAVQTATQDGIVGIDIYPANGDPARRIATVPPQQGESGWSCFSWMEGPPR